MGRIYTSDEDRALLTRDGKTLLNTLARRLGRTPEALRMRLHRRYGWRGQLSAKAEATRAAGMSRSDVARALGVDMSRVQRWIKLGLLPETQTLALNRKYSSIDAAALSAFLETGGALLDYLCPTDPIWRELVSATRTALLAHLLSTMMLADALGLSKLALGHLRRALDLPAPVVPSRGTLPAWYDRAAIGVWLDSHPQYQTQRTKELMMRKTLPLLGSDHAHFRAGARAAVEVAHGRLTRIATYTVHDVTRTGERVELRTALEYTFVVLAADYDALLKQPLEER